MDSRIELRMALILFVFLQGSVPEVPAVCVSKLLVPHCEQIHGFALNL
jgi:hypothetical protein